MKTIAIDFDGVIHKYSQGWKDGSIYDVPVEGVFKAIKTLIDEGYLVYIHSSRKPRQIKKWLDKFLWYYDPMYGDGEDKLYEYGYSCEVVPFYKKFWDKQGVLGITQRKLPAHVYIDDRAFRFGDWPTTLQRFIKKQDPYKGSMNLKIFAVQYLDSIGANEKDLYDGIVGRSIMDLIVNFGEHGHTSSSAIMTMDTLQKLITEYQRYDHPIHIKHRALSENK